MSSNCLLRARFLSSIFCVLYVQGNWVTLHPSGNIITVHFPQEPQFILYMEIPNIVLKSTVKSFEIPQKATHPIYIDKKHSKVRNVTCVCVVTIIRDLSMACRLQQKVSSFRENSRRCYMSRVDRFSYSQRPVACSRREFRKMLSSPLIYIKIHTINK